MTKLQSALSRSFYGSSNIMMYYKRLSNDITEPADGAHKYWGITVTHFENKITDMSYEYQSIINLLMKKVQPRFAVIPNSTVFTKIVWLLHFKTWSTVPNGAFCENNINGLFYIDFSNRTCVCLSNNINHSFQLNLEIVVFC